MPTENYLTGYENKYLQILDQTFDAEYGGFAQQREAWREGQKFPTPLAYKFLLEKNEKYLGMVKTTFNNQYTDINELETRYRLYDPVEGGFHRYSTKRDWSIPHYEKMLPDQAKLIRAYAHLLKITNDDKVKIAFDCSVSFVTNKFLDNNGGFYSSQDAYLEDKYFALPEKEREKIEPPYIDKTRNRSEERR